MQVPQWEAKQVEPWATSQVGAMLVLADGGPARGH